jgi:hypothetical protein
MSDIGNQEAPKGRQVSRKDNYNIGAVRNEVFRKIMSLIIP